MKHRTLLAGICLVACTALATTHLVSQDPGDAPELDPEMMAKWMEFMTPGENHKYLAEKVGKWEGTVSHYMAPGAPAMVNTAISEMTLAMDGRYLIDRTSGDFNGMPFQGLGITGYDNMKKKYVAVWIDNMGTGLMTMEGERKDGSLEFSGYGPDLMSGEYKMYRSVEVPIDENTFKAEMWGPGPDGKEFKVMEITYKRVEGEKTGTGTR